VPRPKEFDTEEALDKAMALFWEKGYVQTSLDELVSHTGVSLYSLYNTFGDKKKLFLRVLDHYRGSVIVNLIGELNQPDASLPQLRQYFAGLVDISKRPERQLGCLMCNTAIELSPHDSEIAQKVDQYLQQVTTALRHTLSNAVRKGELEKDTDIDALTDYFMGVVLGMCLYSRSPASSSAMEKYIETSLSILD
jgi:TetR/AcrR family transcriptional repressor of nem operon